MNDIDRVERAICHPHGCDGTHVQSARLPNLSRYACVGMGTLKCFYWRIIHRPKTYAWSYADDHGKIRHVAILDVPPGNSAVDGAYVAAQAQKQ